MPKTLEMVTLVCRTNCLMSKELITYFDAKGISYSVHLLRDEQIKLVDAQIQLYELQNSIHRNAISKTERHLDKIMEAIARGELMLDKLRNRKERLLAIEEKIGYNKLKVALRASGKSIDDVIVELRSVGNASI